jgi:hypothetical protein
MDGIAEGYTGIISAFALRVRLRQAWYAEYHGRRWRQSRSESEFEGIKECREVMCI